mgnify:FL=1
MFFRDEADVRMIKNRVALREMKDRLADFFSSRPEILFSWLFGSLAEGKDNAYSDVDIAVYVANPILLHNVDWYLELKAELMRLTRHEVDLVLLNTAFPIVKHAANMHKVVLFSRDEQFEAEYSLQIIKEYNDVRYWANRSRKYLLER